MHLAAVLVLAFWGVYFLFVPYFLFHTLRPLTAKEKRSDAKMAALIKRWGDDPDFDGFTQRWFAWSVLCQEMGWFKS
jgi:hypothetical protein